MPLKTIASISAVFVVCITFWSTLLSLCPKPREVGWIGEIYAKKEMAASSVAGPKYLLIGGSSTHYSYSAEEISKLTGFQVINFGSHAGLGGDYILNRAKRSLRKGDTALLALEYQLLSTVPPSTILTGLVATSDLSYVLDAPWNHVANLLFGYSPVQLARDVAAKSIPWTSPLYRSETVTTYGDESSNVPENKLPYMRKVVHEAEGIVMAQSVQLSVSLQEFVAWAHSNDVTVFYTWPPTTERPRYLTTEYAAYFASQADLFEALGVKVLGRQAEYLLPEEEMLDSMYHADVVGARRASIALSRNLCSLVDCPATGARPIM